jgi:hypothetical protein
VVEEGVSPNFDEYDIEEPVSLSDHGLFSLTERQKNIRLRIILGIFTLVLMILGPVMQYYRAEMFIYVLAAGIAFTIGTNLTIGILSIRIEDKAELMERRMTELLSELSTSTEQLMDFNGQLAQFPLQGMLDAMETARDELGPTLSQMNGVSWLDISQAVTTAMDFSDMLDTDKIKNLMAPFVVDSPSVSLVDDPFGVAEEIDFFPPPPPRHRGNQVTSAE